MLTIQGITTALAIGTASYAIYRLWKGRKVTHIKWEDDNDNPANWYLKDPNKFKVIIDGK